MVRLPFEHAHRGMYMILVEAFAVFLHSDIIDSWLYAPRLQVYGGRETK